MGRGICFVALDERLDGGRLRSRHFIGGFEGLREAAGCCSVHLAGGLSVEMEQNLQFI